MKTKLATFLTAYFHPKMLIVLFLGFASGLPLLLVGGTMSAWLYEAGLDKTTIGIFTWVGLPYSFKFLWAPFIDRLSLGWLTRRFGRRRGWMLLTQLCVIASLVWLAVVDPLLSSLLFASVAVVIAFFSASQDVVIDAFRAEYLDEKQYGEGAAMAVFGYRVGMLMAGAGALTLADHVVWQWVYIAMAACMAIGMITVLLASEPANPMKEKFKIRTSGAKAWLEDAFMMPFKDFMRRYPYWIPILLFVLFYRMPDGFIATMATPFFLDIGFSKSEIAVVTKLYGFIPTLVGMFLAGTFIRWLGVPRCLLYFLLAHLLTLLIYAAMGEMAPAGMTPGAGMEDKTMMWMLTLAISMDHLTGGMVTAAAISYMMRLCNLEYTATQYALLSSLAALSSKTLAGTAGWIAEAYGWAGMFVLAALLGTPALGLWFFLRGKQAMPDEEKKAVA